jgi:hypothetical protein
MKRFMLTVVFTCFLSVSVLAGEMPTMGVITTPPPPVGSTTTYSDEDATDTSTLSELLATVVLEIITWP